MRVPPAAKRLPALVLVVAVHCGVLLVLAALTRTRLLEVAPQAAAIEVLLIAGPSVPPTVAGSLPGSRPAAPSPAFPTARPHANVPPPPLPAPSTAIDWDGEARAAAARKTDEDSAHRRRDMAALPRARAFQPTVTRPMFHWDHASTHRVEPLQGGGTLINLNDSCVIVIYRCPSRPAGSATAPPAVTSSSTCATARNSVPGRSASAGVAHASH